MRMIRRIPHAFIVGITWKPISICQHTLQPGGNPTVWFFHYRRVMTHIIAGPNLFPGIYYLEPLTHLARMWSAIFKLSIYSKTIRFLMWAAVSWSGNTRLRIRDTLTG